MPARPARGSRRSRASRSAPRPVRAGRRRARARRRCARSRSWSGGRGFRGRRLGKLERALLPATGDRDGAGDGGEAGEGAYHFRIMNESDFHRAVDAVLARIERAVEASGSLDVDLEAGNLTITCPDAPRLNVKRQKPNRESWGRGPSGGFPFTPAAAQ